MIDAYVPAARAALDAGELPAVIRQDCPTCGSTTPDASHTTHTMPSLGTVVLVTCDGTPVIDPNAVGIIAPGWRPHQEA